MRSVSSTFTVNAARSQRRFRVSRGTKFNLLCADLVRRLDLFRIRINKHAGENVAETQLRYGRAHDCDVCFNVEPALGSDFV